MENKMKISIVMSYYNRQKLLNKTIESLEQSSVKDFELIIVDDASPVPVRCDRADKIIRIEPKDKWYHNPCIPYNMGFREATGDIIMIQNPECYHVGDVLAFTQSHMRQGLYLSFACYAINALETDRFYRGIMPELGNYVFAANSKIKKEYNGWYNHSKYRPVAYHFCSAIMREDCHALGGFDERYAHGVAFDDDDLIRRIRRKYEVRIVFPPYVIHQYHHHFTYEDPRVWRPLHKINQDLYNRG